MHLTFLFIGEAHHVFHTLPLAAELHRLAPDAEMELIFTDEMQINMAEKVYQAYSDFVSVRRILLRPRWLEWCRRIGLIRKRPRIALLLAALPRLRRSNAIIVPERTTTIIRKLLPTTTSLVFSPHGAGDRAIMIDPRDRHFDFVLVAGHKSEARLLKAGTIRPGHYAVNGYVKADLMQKLRANSSSAVRLFDNDRPTVLYAPHFRRALSSWDKFGLALIEAFAGQDRFNLIVAPHYRLFSDASQAERRRLEALSQTGKILVDLHSDRLFDMSYTIAADIYVGDVSSQVYEFLTTPRPCVFLDAHATNWRDNPDYRFWTLGDVANSIKSLMAALEKASERHQRYRDLQIAALADSVGDDPTGAGERGAKAILDYLHEVPSKQ